jgi:DNA-directed RNA polymerase II subunit RPB1
MSNDSKNISKIIGIQFSILSPDEIRKNSVAEITNRDTYVNNKPVIGGLFDPRMGVLEPGLICPTDGLDYINTPGYFGHIELARPVFYIQYLPTVLKILKCICFKCSKLLISKNKYNYLNKLSNEARWNSIFHICNKVSRCGEENEDGCGCSQPKRIKKEGLATLFAEWETSENDEKINIKITPEIAIKLFRRISDEDVNFMGFSSLWSRPEWMICEVLPIAPPSVRPSVKHDAQQRSEDDITHIIVNIIKTNKVLQEKIEQNAPSNIIEDWSTFLQYYIATQVDNKIPGALPVAQRSGRPLKSIKERLNGKTGRVRGNLMGKRVNFSARSVITADPNLSIRELGVPLKIAKNITKPVIVNDKNKKFLMSLVIRGPDEWPGAKILEKKNGENISLRHSNREKQILENGDIVHRHMIDGDAILFNRQPTLHRMSMMCHIVKIMKKGDTFRMNVADTKPYNADFDGDEMNLHMPQDVESECELLHLAHIPYQIVSPASNSPIIGIFQDSLLGANRFTRENIKFNHREAMNLLMNTNNVNTTIFKNKEINSFEILSQIIPNISLNYTTSLFDEDKEKLESSNNVLQITNGKYVKGNLEKGCLGSSTRGILHRIYNDFGSKACSNFIDDFQNIITEYMKVSSYSVGISDLISNEETKVQINEIIDSKKNEVQDVIEQLHLGVFENDTGKKNEEEFEMQVNNILNKATAEAGKIGRKTLNTNNRFVIMVNSGSKGNDLNIAQMISCLGQQSVNGKRIPYGFEDRTLPHFSKYNDSPEARGFVKNSYIRGLTPEELFFHAMGGRTGLIDTAVKTSQTGYIQRRLIKGLEDIKVEYDMTVRNSKNKIVQFQYGDDNIETTKIENSKLNLLNKTIEEIYLHYYIPIIKDNDLIFNKEASKKLKKEKKLYEAKANYYSEKMINSKNIIIKEMYKYKHDQKIHMPISFQNIIVNIRNQNKINQDSVVDITPFEAITMIEENFENMSKYYYCIPSDLMEILYYYNLSPKELLITHRYNKRMLTYLLDVISLTYKKSIVSPGEMVGMIAAQSIGEPTTQMTLNTFHYAGVSSKSNITRGVPRIEEILSLTENPKSKSLSIYLNDEDQEDKNKAKSIMYMIEYTKLQEIVSNVQICFDPKDDNTTIEEDKLLMQQYFEFEKMIDSCSESITNNKEKSKWIIRIEMDQETMLEKNITMDDIHFALNNSAYSDDINCIYNDYNMDKLVFRIRINNLLKKDKNKKVVNPLDQSDEIYLLKNFQDNLLNNITLRGIRGIDKVIMRKVQDEVIKKETDYLNKEFWVLDTVGSNLLDILALDYINVNRTTSNNITEIYNVLGIEAARQSIYNELTEVFEGMYINHHHLTILCDRMTYSYKMISIFRHGINNDDIGPIAKASFEETPEMFLKAARHGDLDHMKGVSSNVMCGQHGYYGTSAFQLVLDINKMKSNESYEFVDDVDMDEVLIKSDNVKCTNSDLKMNQNIINIKESHIEDDEDYEINI